MARKETFRPSPTHERDALELICTARLTGKQPFC